MRVLTGRSLLPGQAAGRIFLYQRRPAAAAGASPAPPEARAREITRFRETLAATLRLLAAREAEWSRRGGDEARYAFMAYQAALEDQSLWSGVAGEIDRAGCDAPHALLAATARLAGVLAGVRDAMHQERRLQLEEATGWLWRRLVGRPGPALAEAPHGAIVVADDLPPAELLLADPLRVAAVVVAAGDSRLTGIPNPAGIPVAVGVTGLLETVRSGQRAMLRQAGETVELCLDPPPAEWEAAAAAAVGERRRAALALSADGVPLPLWALVRSLRAAEQALSAGTEQVLLWPRRTGLAPPPPGCWLAAPVAGDLLAPMRLLEALSERVPAASVAAVAGQLADLAAAPALLARHRRARRPLAALVVDLSTLKDHCHPGVLQVLQAAASACTRERAALAVGGSAAAMRLLPLWLGAGATAWWGDLADGTTLREQMGRLRVAACREAFPALLAESGAIAVEAAVARLYGSGG